MRMVRSQTKPSTLERIRRNDRMGNHTNQENHLNVHSLLHFSFSAFQNFSFYRFPFFISAFQNFSFYPPMSSTPQAIISTEFKPCYICGAKTRRMRSATHLDGKPLLPTDFTRICINCDDDWTKSLTVILKLDNKS